LLYQDPHGCRDISVFGMQSDRQTGIEADRQTTQMHKQTHRQTNRQNRQTDRQTDRHKYQFK
jgi:hypothetical protein